MSTEYKNNDHLYFIFIDYVGHKPVTIDLISAKAKFIMEYSLKLQIGSELEDFQPHKLRTEFEI